MELDPSLSRFWNATDLLPPEIIPCKISGNKSNITGSSMLICIEKVIHDLDCLDQLNVEGAMISRLVYRYKRKLRTDKGFKSLQKINHLLHNYLKLKFVSMIEEVKNCLYDNKGPSRQVLEWCLVNILRFSSLFNKIYIVCMDGGRYLKDRFSSGDFWTAAALCYAAVSRVWTLSQFVVKCSSVWFEELMVFLPHMSCTLETWLPDNFVFPESIREWLNNPIYLEKDSSSNGLKSGLVDKTNFEKNVLNSCKSFMVTEDIGESISRETGQLMKKQIVDETKSPGVKKGNIPSRSKTAGFFKKLNSKDALIDFMCKEGIFRQTKSDCITKHLTDSKWSEMKMSLSKHIENMTKSESEQEEKQKISRAVKCIQYYLFHSHSEDS